MTHGFTRIAKTAAVAALAAGALLGAAGTASAASAHTDASLVQHHCRHHGDRADRWFHGGDRHDHWRPGSVGRAWDRGHEGYRR